MNMNVLIPPMVVSLLLAGCATHHPSWQGTYKATARGVTGTAKVVAAGPKVRMEFQSPRRTSTSIIRYDRDVVWLLAPTVGRYAEIGTRDLLREFPLFFDPSVKVEKTELGRESIHGIETVKYSVRVHQGNAVFEGLLWDAVPPWPVPVKWEGTSGEVAVWEGITSVAVDPALFEIPPGLARLEKQEPQPLTVKRSSE